MSSSNHPAGTTVNKVASASTPLICGGHSRPVPHLSYSAITDDGYFLVSACLDGKPMLRNGQSGDWIGTFLGHKGAVWAAAITDNALLAATGSADYTAKIWDTLSGECKQGFEHKRIVRTVDFSKDGSTLVTGGQEKLIRVFDLQKAVELKSLPGHTEPIRVVQWLTDSLLVSGGADNVLRVWDLKQGKEVTNVPTKGAIASIEISRDGKTISMTAGKGIFFLDAASFAEKKSYVLNMELNCVALHPSGNRFVFGGAADFYDHVCDYETGKELEVHKGHHGPVHCLKYSPDGEIFASGSEDGTVRLIQTDPKPYGLWQNTDDTTTTNNNNAATNSNTNATNSSTTQP